ncbi:SLATT domain-containing protein [Sporocytophaga myxococcoides]|uniref:SLATT domain-containing protein n=1 Tax=Sporocytophaga myxococcoides TaxID=153721 RepID=UPI00040D157B|nr:SLATT domain-containing protein [Sporocytophaga myxococcoides]
MKANELNNDRTYKSVQLWIDKTRNKKRRYAAFYKFSRVLTFFGSASITIIVGWKKPEELEVASSNLILFISAFIAFTASIEGLFDLKDKAKSYDVFLFELRRLRDRMSYDYSKDPKFYEQNKDEYFSKYEGILNAQKMIIENSYESEE